MSDSLSVLVVDDHEAMAQVSADLLEVKGFITYPACSGAEALEILREHPVDIMVTDVIMPEMNGLELYRETKKIYPRLTTFFMTAYAADDLIQQGMREGIKIVLNKPVDMDLLLSILRTIGRDWKLGRRDDMTKGWH
jgi:two-component system response regulator YesN